MKLVNDVCKRVIFIKIPFVRIKAFKYPRKRELCIRFEYRAQTWGKSSNEAWKCRSYYFHY